MTRIMLAGASGLVGHQAANLMAASGAEVHALLRTRSEQFASAVIQNIGTVEEWPDMVSRVVPDVAISCLGTTMRVAGSQAAFRAVDFGTVLAFADAARAAGAKHMIAVSSVGASAKSGSFYLRTKGEVEGALSSIGFNRLDIIRPGLLTGGDRPESRPGESLGIMLAPLTDLLMLGSFSRYRSTPSAKVAKAIAALVALGGQGRFIHENDEINTLAG
jgi:uncharacterized protein YbjT (DUF2867 family)